MKITIPRIELTQVAQRLQNIIASRPAIPILGNIQITAKGNQVTLVASDLLLTASTTLQAQVLEEGSVCLPGRRFFALIKELQPPYIEISWDGSEQSAEIRTGSSQFRIPALAGADFPPLPVLEGAHTCTLPSKQLRSLFSKTLFAASRDDSRQELNALCLHSLSGTPSCSATDGKRLATSPLPPELASLTDRCLVPIRAAEELVRQLEDSDRPLTLSLTSDRLCVSLDNWLFFSKLLATSYPELSSVVPSPQEKPIRIHREELLSLLRQTLLFAPEDSPSVRLSFSPGNLSLFASSRTSGEGQVSMPISYEGPALTIAFNPNYLIEALRHSREELISLHLTDPYQPGLITTEEAKFVVMPLRIS